MKYLALDCEFTGLDPTVHNLLTAAFIVADKEGNILDSLDLALLPDDNPRGRGNYTVCMDAMNINKIDLSAHDQIAYTREEATKLLKDFLDRHSLIEKQVYSGEKQVYSGEIDYDPVYETLYKRDYLIPVGHNMNLDIQFIKSYFKGLDWEKYVSYRNLDTASVSRFLMHTGILAIEKISLPSLAERFGVVYSAHNAMEDARATLEVLMGMTRFIQDD